VRLTAAYRPPWGRQHSAQIDVPLDVRNRHAVTVQDRLPERGSFVGGDGYSSSHHRL